MKVITICGSSRFVDVMAVCAWLLERDERAITLGLHLLPRWYTTKAAIRPSGRRTCGSGSFLARSFARTDD